MRLHEYISGFNRRLAFPWMSSIGLRLTGYKLVEVYQSPEKHLELATVMDREFGADFIYPLDYGAVYMDVLQLPLLRSDYDFPSTLDNPIKTEQMLKKLPVPDFNTDIRLSNYLKGLRLISESTEKPMAMSIRGPFTQAVELVGMTDFARGIIRNPGFINEVLKYTSELVSNYAKAVTDAGARLLCVSEPTAVILSPDRFKTMIRDPLREILTVLPESVWSVLHICGDTNYILPEMLECGVDGLSLDQIMNFSEVAKKIPREVVLMGNLDPVYVLRDGDTEYVEEQTRMLLESMRNFPNFIFSFGCDCTRDTPLENLKSAIQASQKPDYR